MIATFLFNNQNYITMKNIYKISAILLVSLTMVITSCKKDEQIIEGCTDITATNYQSLATSNDGSCIYAPAIEGCTDSNAMNFLSIATSNDGSCIYAYDIAQGIWNITSECEDLTITIPLIGEFDVPLADMFPETIEITGEGNSVVSLDINDSNVLADIANDGTVTIQDNQTISFDTGGFDPTGTIGMVDVDITGTGTIFSASNGDLFLNLAFSILSIPADADCEITFTK